MYLSVYLSIYTCSKWSEVSGTSHTGSWGLVASELLLDLLQGSLFGLLLQALDFEASLLSLFRSFSHLFRPCNGPKGFEGVRV